MSSKSNHNPSGSRTLILLLLLSGSAALSISCAFADTAVTISAAGSHSYYLGEKVVLYGQGSDTDTVYLYMTGPNLPAVGGKLASPGRAIVSGEPDSFTVVKTKPDKTWEYSYYTANLQLDAGTYTVYAASHPVVKDPPGQDATSIGIILKKPFITANISSLAVVKGQPFTITGIAEGIPPAVQAWFFGNNYVSTIITPVNPDASFTLNCDAVLSEKLPRGQNYLVVQHPMQDNQFDLDARGEYVRNGKLNNGTNLFKINGPGSLQGSDAAEALAAAFSESMTQDETYSNDTYTMIPFQVADTGSEPSSAQAVTGSNQVQSLMQYAPLLYAPIGVIILILVIAGWKYL